MFTAALTRQVTRGGEPVAKLNANINRATYSIKKFLGLNQSDSGETHLKAGEASKLVNFRVTDAGELTPRPVLS